MQRVVRGLVTILLLTGSILPAVSVHADNTSDIQILSFIQQDMNNAGQVDTAIIDCTCVTDHDQVLVFDGAGDMVLAQAWQNGTDTTNDTWVFDIGAKGRASLIVAFRTDGGDRIAEFYDDVDGDGAIAYHKAGAHIVIDESPYWSLQVIAREDWIAEDGRPNLNLEVLLDKPLLTGLSNNSIAQKYMAHDGNPDVNYTVADTNNDGVPEYFVGRVLAEIPKIYGVERAWVYSNSGAVEAKRPASALFWPLLDMRPPSNGAASSIRYFDLIPNVSVDWQAAQITIDPARRGFIGAGFTLPGYPSESGYDLRSLQYIVPGRLNQPDYETPMAYYDLAANLDHNPELNIRLFSGNQSDSAQAGWTELRYSWNQFLKGPLTWDYKLGAMGNTEIEGIVRFPDFGLRMIPFEELPYWATDREWKLTTFVANEGGDRTSAEGIYAWTPWSGADPVSAANPSQEALNASRAYLSGVRTRPPYEYLSTIWPGYRGEYNLVRPLKPLLYFSSIDRRLHLVGAEHGLMDSGNGQKVIYDNGGKGDYLDRWYLYDGTTLRQELDFVHPYLLYSGNGGVLLRSVQLGPSIFETLPPRNHEEWETLGGLLEENKPSFAADDLASMISQFGKPDMTIAGSSLRDFRQIADGFRFVLNLQPSFSVDGSNGPDLRGLTPGEYLVSYGDTFTVQALTPAQPEVVPGTFEVSDPEPKVFEPVQITAVLRNAGLEDLNRMLVQASVAEPGEPSRVVTQTTVALLADQLSWVTFDWVPTSPGAWKVDLSWDDTDGSGTSTSIRLASLNVQVQPQPSPGLGHLWQLSNVSYPATVLLMLLGIAVGAATITYAALRRDEIST